MEALEQSLKAMLGAKLTLKISMLILLPYEA
jgi:hypothetical protein